MYSVWFYCPSQSWLGWQGKSSLLPWEEAIAQARMLQMGTRGTAVVNDQYGQEVYRIG